MVQCFRPVQGQSKSGLVAMAPDLWTVEAKQCVCYRPPMQPRYPYSHRAVLIRLEDGSLFVLSPIQLTTELRAEVDQIGAVKYIVSPNHLHQLYMGDWSQAYPEAKLYASPRLTAKRPDLTFAKTLVSSEPEPEWQGQIDQCLFGKGNGWIDELVFFHRTSRTVVFTDLIMDFDPANFSPLSRLTTRLNQMYRHTPRGIQLAHMFDRAALRDSLATVRSWQPEYAVVAHSPWLCVEGKQQVAEFLDEAFDWLAPRPAIVDALLGVARLLTLLLVVLPVHAVIVLIADVLYPRLVGQQASQS